MQSEYFRFYFCCCQYLFLGSRFKNMFVTYLGMIVGGDYIYSHVNFLGLNLR